MKDEQTDQQQPQLEVPTTPRPPTPPPLTVARRQKDDSNAAAWALLIVAMIIIATIAGLTGYFIAKPAKEKKVETKTRLAPEANEFLGAHPAATNDTNTVASATTSNTTPAGVTQAPSNATTVVASSGNTNSPVVTLVESEGAYNHFAADEVTKSSSRVITTNGGIIATNWVETTYTARQRTGDGPYALESMPAAPVNVTVVVTSAPPSTAVQVVTNVITVVAPLSYGETIQYTRQATPGRTISASNRPSQVDPWRLPSPVRSYSAPQANCSPVRVFPAPDLSPLLPPAYNGQSNNPRR